MSWPRLREAGDSALLLELGADIDETVNARAIGVAGALRREALAGVRDVVSTFRSVAVHFDPLAADFGAVRAAIDRALAAPLAAAGGRTIEVPTAYGGEWGPDIEEVGLLAGLSALEVARRHSGSSYRVFMLGFLPGFAYMGSVDPAIAAPRRATPRVRVPAGSVGVAGLQTGVYPVDSPGGWQIIGRTPLRVFDPDRTPASLFAPGDRVRFVPERTAGGVSSPPPRPPARSASAEGGGDDAGGSVVVLSPGLFTTVQDGGRWGHQAEGVPVSGSMDLFAHRLANALVGNSPEAATLELTLAGPELRVDHATTIGVAGADLGATVDGSPLPACGAVRCRTGTVIRFAGRRTGARAYVAFAGGIDVPLVLGSRSTHVRSSLGGVSGRAVRPGDVLPLGGGRGHLPGVVDDGPRPWSGGARLRVIPGPHDDCFPPDAVGVLLETRFSVAPQSDRMGYRLTGGTLPQHQPPPEMISDATFAGGVQVPPSGDPILLMADRPTTGGYPQIATVITADLPLAAQLAPGDWIEFETCSRSEAVAALAAQEGRLRELR